MPHKKKSLSDFVSTFVTEAKCREYLTKKRWPNGFVCPKCGTTHGWELSNGSIECSRCHKQTSVTAGTILHRSHVPLTKWFIAFFLVMNDKGGISAVELCNMADVTYKTAWYMVQRIRMTMAHRDSIYLLSGQGEFDNAYIGGPTTGKKADAAQRRARYSMPFLPLRKANRFF